MCSSCMGPNRESKSQGHLLTSRTTKQIWEASSYLGHDCDVEPVGHALSQQEFGALVARSICIAFVADLERYWRDPGSGVLHTHTSNFNATS